MSDQSSFSVAKLLRYAAKENIELDKEIDKSDLKYHLQECLMSVRECEVLVSELFRVYNTNHNNQKGKPTLGVFCQEYTRMKNLKSVVGIRKVCLKKKSGRNDAMTREEILKIFCEHHHKEDAEAQIEILFKALDKHGDGELEPMQVLQWYSETFRLRRYSKESYDEKTKNDAAAGENIRKSGLPERAAKNAPEDEFKVRVPQEGGEEQEGGAGDDDDDDDYGPSGPLGAPKPENGAGEAKEPQKTDDSSPVAPGSGNESADKKKEESPGGTPGEGKAAPEPQEAPKPAEASAPADDGKDPTAEANVPAGDGKDPKADANAPADDGKDPATAEVSAPATVGGEAKVEQS